MDGDNSALLVVPENSSAGSHEALVLTRKQLWSYMSMFEICDIKKELENNGIGCQKFSRTTVDAFTQTEDNGNHVLDSMSRRIIRIEALLQNTNIYNNHNCMHSKPNINEMKDDHKSDFKSSKIMNIKSFKHSDDKRNVVSKNIQFHQIVSDDCEIKNGVMENNIKFKDPRVKSPMYNTHHDNKNFKLDHKYYTPPKKNYTANGTNSNAKEDFQQGKHTPDFNRSSTMHTHSNAKSKKMFDKWKESFLSNHKNQVPKKGFDSDNYLKSPILPPGVPFQRRGTPGSISNSYHPYFTTQQQVNEPPLIPDTPNYFKDATFGY